MSGHKNYSFPELIPGTWSLCSISIPISVQPICCKFFYRNPYHAYNPTTKGLANLAPGLFCVKQWLAFHFMYHNASILEQVFSAILPVFVKFYLNYIFTLSLLFKKNMFFLNLQKAFKAKKRSYHTGIRG